MNIKPFELLLKMRGAVAASLLAWLSLLPTAAAQNPGLIRVSGSPQQQMTYGMDFERMWHFRNKGQDIDLDELAQTATVDVKVDYVRVAINPGVELVEGKVDWSQYDHQVAMMSAIQKVRPDIKWFLSPRPVHNEMKGAPFTPFPLWISIFENPFKKDENTPREFLRFEWEKAADYYLRHIRFFQERGFDITYLDAINEATKHLDPLSVSKMIGRLRETLGEEMPLVIAPSAHNWGEAVRWIHEAGNGEAGIFWDITACHNTRPWGSMEEFAKEAKRLGKPIWNTELHGFKGPDDAVIENIKVLFDHIRAGYAGINDWLSLGNEKNEHKMLRNIRGELVTMRYYYIFKQLVNSSGGAGYLDSTVPEELESTMAFYHREKGHVTVWALNNSEEQVEGLVMVDNYHCTPISVHAWTPDNGREGEEVTEGLNGDSSLRYTLEPGSLYCFTFAQHN